MFAAEWRGVETDWCASCGGVWLDSGEYELLSGHSPEFARETEAVSIPPRAGRRCPICDETLRRALWKALSLTLDRCRGGHGLYFDLGELAAALAKSPAGKDSLLAEHFKKFIKVHSV